MKDEALTAHFNLSEFSFSRTAVVKGIDNTIPASIMPNIRRLAGCLELIRTTIGRPIVVTSGYRCKELNRAVGGVPNSHHTQGLAADIVCPGITPYDLAVICATVKDIPGGNERPRQIILEFDAWVHIGIAYVLPANALLTYRATNTGKTCQQGIIKRS